MKTIAPLIPLDCIIKVCKEDHRFNLLFSLRQKFHQKPPTETLNTGNFASGAGRLPWQQPSPQRLLLLAWTLHLYLLHSQLTQQQAVGLVT